MEKCKWRRAFYVRDMSLIDKLPALADNSSNAGTNRRMLMLLKKTAIAFTLGLLGCALVPANVHAAGATTFTVPIVNVTFNPSSCSTITPTQVTLNGQYHFSVHTTKNQDGSYTTKIQSEAHGTAVDSNGAQYVFDYINHEQDITSSPSDVPPLLGMFTDRFQLVSKGSAPNLKVQFQIVYSLDANYKFTLITGVFKGDPNCDPI
jgi:hypothetical protein